MLALYKASGAHEKLSVNGILTNFSFSFCLKVLYPQLTIYGFKLVQKQNFLLPHQRSFEQSSVVQRDYKLLDF